MRAFLTEWVPILFMIVILILNWKRLKKLKDDAINRGATVLYVTDTKLNKGNAYATNANKSSGA